MGCPKLAYSLEKSTALRCVWNSREQSKTCVSWYDYGARMYDPALGRFIGIDPIIENWPNHTPYNYAFSNPVTLIDLWGLQGVNPNAYFNWMASNPMGAIAEGFRQYFDAAASLFTAKAGVTLTTKTTTSEVKAGNASASTSVVTESKAEVTMDGSSIFDYNGQNSKSISDINPFKVETSTTTKTVQEGNVTVTVDGVPVNISNSQENTTTGESKNTTEVSVGVSSKNVDANAYVNTSTTTNSNGTTTTAAAGAKANVTVNKSGNTTTQAGAYVEVETKLDEDKP